MKNFLYSLIVLSTLVAGACSAEEPKRKLLGPFLAKGIQTADHVEVNNLEAMKFLPQAFTIPDRRTSKTLSVESQAKLVKLLSGSEEIDPASRLPSCQYEPGYAFSFYQDAAGQNLLATVLLCFNCDVWAVGGNIWGLPQGKPRGIFAFGDAKADRSDLKQLTTGLFPVVENLRLPK